jgi:uncharacterized ferritin-like protein (DUF455 family)
MDDAPSATIRAFCLELLQNPELEAKLASPEARLADPPEPALRIMAPARSAALAMASGAAPLPRPHALESAEARATVLARLAHHELQAAELFAWALLRWPDAPGALRRSWLGVLDDEQRHCRMYLERLAAQGSDFGLHAPHSDYFWKHVPTLDAAPEGPASFLCVLGLTLEQANLDFAAVYRDAFRRVGDEQTARVLEQVQADEEGHVALAARWLGELLPDEPDEVARYERAVPFPFTAARAKGRRFDVQARRRAGLGESFIRHIQNARSRQNTRSSEEQTR